MSGLFFSTVDFVNRLEEEMRAGRQRLIVAYLLPFMEFVILDELGYLSSCRLCGQKQQRLELRKHIFCKSCSKTEKFFRFLTIKSVLTLK